MLLFLVGGLLAAIIIPNLMTGFSRPPKVPVLHLAILREDEETIQQIIRRQHDKLSETDRVAEQTALHWAVILNQPDTVDALVLAGMDVSADNRHGITPLHFAALLGRVIVARHLLRYGASLNAQDAYGYTPLHYALIRQATPWYTWSWCGSDLFAEFPCVSLLNELAINGEERREIVSMLLEQGPPSSTYTREGRSLLHAAAQGGDLVVFDQLVSTGLDILATDTRGRTPLHEAASSGHDDIVEWLVERGADIRARAHDGQTPLVCAVRGRIHNQHTLHILRDPTVDIEEFDNPSKAPCSHTLLDNAALYNNVTALQFLLDAGLNVRTAYGEAALRTAMTHHHDKIVEKLVRAGVSVPASEGMQTPSYEDATPSACP